MAVAFDQFDLTRPFLLIYCRIKKGEAEIGVRPRGADGQGGSGLVIASREASHDEDAVEQESTQSVLAFTMKDWRRLRDENFAPGEEGGLPHRTGSKIPKHTHQSNAES